MVITMNRFSLAFITLSLLATTGSVMAADPVPVKAGSGTINFTGVINSDACSVEGTNLNRTISVPMGEVSIKDMGTAEMPKGSGKLSAENFDMKISCNAGTKVALILAVSSGISRGSKVIGFCSAAVSQLCSAGNPWSTYTPVEARSLTETMPILMGSCGFVIAINLGVIYRVNLAYSRRIYCLRCY